MTETAEGTEEAFVITDEEGLVLEVNSVFERLFGLAQADASGKPLAELIIAPRFRAAYRASRRQVLSAAPSAPACRTNEFSGLGADRGEFSIALRIAPMSDRPPRVATWIRDLTELQASSTGARRRLALYQHAEELAGIGSWELETETGELFWSDNLFRIYGLEPNEITPSVEYVISHIHPGDSERVARGVEDLMRTGRLRPLRYRYVLPDGSVRHMQARMSLVAEAPGLPPHTLGALQDVTEQYWAEQEIAAHFIVSDALADWRPGEPGVLRLLRDLAEALDFEVGVLWVPQADDLLARTIWQARSLNAPDLGRSLRGVRLTKKVGLAGRAWAERRPVAVASLAEGPRCIARQLADKYELHGGLALPVTFGDEVLAVLGFATQARVELPDRLMRSLVDIADAIGHFFARRRGELTSSPLTPRELDVLKLAAEGCNTGQVAERLCLSGSTIKTHFEHVFHKLGVHDRASAVGEAVRQGLID
jgi:PAS domain S-box-containing protein